MAGLALVKGKTMEWRKPANGYEFIGCLVGGYKDTREGIKIELKKRYGINCHFHFGLEKRKDRSIFVPTNTEICILLSDDVKDMLERVLKACKAAGVGHLGISRKMHTWDPIFAAEGFSNPPKWRDGVLIPNKADPASLEEKRLADLAEVDARHPRSWVDPKLANATAKLADAIPKTVAVAVAQVVKQGPVDFGKAVVAARTAMGWSKAKLAKEMNITTGGVDQWEGGKVKAPMYEQYVALRRVFPDFPEMKDLRGEGTYKKRMAEAAKNGPPAAEAAPAVAPATPEVVLTPPPPVAEVAPTPPPPPPPPVAPPVVAAPVVAAPPPPMMDQEAMVTIRLRGGGTLTLSGAVNMFKMRADDRKFVNDLIDRLQSYEEAQEAEEKQK